jgi:DNA-binding NtrC family response regulator
MKRSILIVDDDARVRTSVAHALGELADEVRVAEDGTRALSEFGSGRPDLLITDVRMPGVDGLELLRLVKERAPETTVVLMTAFDDLPTVATAMREGAEDFLVKPLDLRGLRNLVERIFEDRRLRNVTGAVGAVPSGDDQPLIGHDPRMIAIFKLVGQVAATRATVIVRGESGTGKELIARAIHTSSPFAQEPFVAVNCTALPATLLESELFGHVKGAFTGASADRRGRFALAEMGTIFLDEIGDTSPDFQTKLLRVLQEQEYYPIGAERPERSQARVIAATHRDLEALVASGDFRQDLYYRLRVVEIVVPPLRERVADIPPLAEHLVHKVSEAIGREPPVLSSEAVDVLTAHRWPGNVRELENCLTRAVVQASGGVVRAEHVDLGSGPSSSSAMTSLEEMEREHVAQVLMATGGHKARAAEILGVSRPRLDRLIGKYGLTDLAPGRTGQGAVSPGDG